MDIQWECLTFPAFLLGLSIRLLRVATLTMARIGSTKRGFSFACGLLQAAWNTPFHSSCLLGIQEACVWMSIYLCNSCLLSVTPAYHRLLMNLWVLSNQEKVQCKQPLSLSSSCSPPPAPWLLFFSPLSLYMQQKQLGNHLTST